MEQTPSRGTFLIANPRLQDPNFSRTVVLMCEYNEEGAFGLVVNRSINAPISEVLKNNSNAAGNNNKVFNGGPVQTDHLLYLHNRSGKEADSKKICEGVYLGGDADYLNSLLQNKENGKVSYRLYIGSSGWGPGQLDEELKIKSWFICPAKKNYIFQPDPEKIWSQVLRSMGGQYRLLSSYPLDPNLN